ncbi:MAG TPA: hypothetical protein VG148_14540 [Pyrinomonadaceae bacterium]|nr:hypothetical protein [Pyrinomonadaceae bacterium]
MRLRIKLLLLVVALAAPSFGRQAGAHPYASTVPMTEARIFAEGVVSTADHEDEAAARVKPRAQALG